MQEATLNTFKAVGAILGGLGAVGSLGWGYYVLTKKKRLMNQYLTGIEAAKSVADVRAIRKRVDLDVAAGNLAPEHYLVLDKKMTMREIEMSGLGGSSPTVFAV